MDHVLEDHKDGCYDRNHPDLARHCPIWDGDLSLCKVCGGVEGSMPTDCPGDRMHRSTQDAVYDGLLDFRDGEWRNQPAKHWERQRYLP